jgi:hypothetical protein
VSVNRIASAATAMVAPPRTPSVKPPEYARKKTVEPAAIVSLRSHDNSGWEAVKGGHSVQEAGNLHEVPNHALQRVRSVLQRGWDSMRGGHRVQQATYEPTVSNAELTSNIRNINRNNMSFAGGSTVQHEVRSPSLADDFGPQARRLAESVATKLKQAQPHLGKLQAARLQPKAAAILAE